MSPITKNGCVNRLTRSPVPPLKCGSLREVVLQIKQAVGGSHKGSRNSVNEDAILRLSEVPVYAVADGMGGEGGGNVASATALAMVKRRAAQLKQFNASIHTDRSTKNRLDLMGFMDRLFNGASREIRHSATRASRPDVGTTLLVTTIVDEFAYVAHVGNSRAYLLRDGELQRLTEDHTIAELRQRRGRGKPHNEGEGQVLYQCLGGSFEVEVDLAEVRLMGEIFFCCARTASFVHFGKSKSWIYWTQPT